MAATTSPGQPDFGRARHRMAGSAARSRISLLAVLLLITAAGTAGFWWFGLRDGSGAAGNRCVADTLRVVAAPEIAAVIQSAADETSACARITIAAEEPGLTARRDAATTPDVWIPSSSAWLQVAAANGITYAAHDGQLAVSPIVLAAPAPVTAALTRNKEVTWLTVAQAVAARQLTSLRMPDSLRSSVGLLAQYAVRTSLTAALPDPGTAELAALTVRSRLADPNADPAALLARVPATDPAAQPTFPLTEQQFWLYHRQQKSTALTESYPVDVPMVADYPLAIRIGTAATPARQALADQLFAALRTETADRALLGAGFRLPASRAAGRLPAGLPMTYGTATDLPPDGSTVLRDATQWSKYQTLKSNILLLVDVSGSMNEKVIDKAGRPTTKAELLRRSGADAAQLFGDETSLGVWTFGTPTPTSPAHVEILPVGPLTQQIGSETRRSLFQKAISLYSAADGAGTPLYQSILDASATMRPLLRSDALTLVIVLTDGHDEQTRYAMSRADFLTKLRDQSAGRPVRSTAWRTARAPTSKRCDCSPRPPAAEPPPPPTQPTWHRQWPPCSWPPTAPADPGRIPLGGYAGQPRRAGAEKMLGCTRERYRTTCSISSWSR